MPVVTVTSSSAGVPAVSFTFNAANASGLSVAQQISNALQGAATPFPSGSSTLNVTTVNASGAAPTVSGGSTQELFISSVASSANVIAPSGYGYIVNAAQTATTITAAANTLILTGAFGGTFLESGSATIVAAGGNNVISQSGAGSVLLLGGDAGQSARTKGGEREWARAFLANPQPGLDGLTCDLRDGHTLTSGLSLKSRGQVVGQAYCCALHTCILHAARSLVNRLVTRRPQGSRSGRLRPR